MERIQSSSSEDFEVKQSTHLDSHGHDASFLDVEDEIGSVDIVDELLSPYGRQCRNAILA